MLYLGFFKNKTKNYDSMQKTSSEIIWPDHVVSLNVKNFEEFIQKYPLSIIDFWASWCSPCKAMGPRFRRLSNIYKGKIAFGKLDVQKNKDIAEKYKIKGIPHMIFFKKGRKIFEINGLKSVGDIKHVIEDILKNVRR